MPIAPRAGVGLKPQHYREVLERQPDLGFWEVHAENYMGAGGPPHYYLGRIREYYPLSLHGVGLSIGGESPLDRAHLLRLKALIDRYQPQLFSEHLAWSTHDGVYFDDLLPLPYNKATLERVCRHIDETQDAVGRQLLLENPATYLAFEESALPETEFLAEVVRRTGCRLLLDVNNVFVSARNHNFDATAYVEGFPLSAVGEIHLAGHDERDDDAEAPLLIDAHGSPVADPVWALFEHTIRLRGPVPALIERDADVPPLAELLAEARRADAILGNEHVRRSRFLDAAE